MTRILFLLDIALRDPKRGTPLHISFLLREIAKKHELFICAASAPEWFQGVFIPFPKERGIKKLSILRQIVRAHGVSHVFTATHNGLVPSVLLKLTCGVKIVEEIHGMSFDELYADHSIGRIRYFYMKWKVWLLLSFFDKVIVMSKKLVEYYAPISQGWVLAYGAVDAQEIPDSSARIRDSKTFVVGYMGNTKAYQGLPWLIQAVGILKQEGLPVRLHLILSGDSGEVEQLLERHSLQGVTTIHRNLSHHDAHQAIADSDVLTIPRADTEITKYAFPCKLAEYLATGIPTVATRVGSTAYELREGFEKCCILIDSNDIARNAVQALKRVYGMSPEERRALGSRARRYAQESFSWEAFGNIVSRQF